MIAFNIDDAVRQILDESEPISLRALKLYELQLVILFCKHPSAGKTAAQRPEPVGDGYCVWVEPALLNRPLTYATSIFLQFMGSSPSDTSRSVETFRSLVNVNEEYTSCVNFFQKKGGWGLVRRTRHVKYIEEDIESYIDMARETAKIVAFSLRFQSINGRPKLVGGLTAARMALEKLRTQEDVGRAAVDFRPKKAIATIRNYWKSHRLVPVLLYLAYFEKVILLQPPDMTKPQFPISLLKRAGNRAGLFACLSRHNAICRYLRRYRGYVASEITAEGLQALDCSPFEPLPDQIISIARSMP